MKSAIPTSGQTLNANGTGSASPATGGAASRPPIEFPPDSPLRSLAAAYYAAGRFLAGGLPLSRLVSFLLLALAGIWVTGLLPGRWTGVTLALVLFIVHIGYSLRLRGRDYVTFTPTPSSDDTATPLAGDEKVPVYVTGLLSVEGRYRRFTFAPAFYRTFATGEHALLSLVRQRRLSPWAAWPQDELGMWYAFIAPPQIQSLRTGELHFSAEPLPAVAIDYTVTLPAKNRLRRERTTTETLFIAATDPQDAGRILRDLLCNAEAAVVASAHTAQPKPK